MTAPAQSPASTQSPASAHSIVDGDTIKFAGTTWRLHGIDAPESRQTCADGWPAGRMATAYLTGRMRGRTTTCEQKTKDRYGRTVGVRKADGEDVGEAMVRQGMAFAYMQYSWRYLPQDWHAWFDGVGMHAHGCEKPWEWRAQERGKSR